MSQDSSVAELRALVVDSNASIASRNRAAFWLRERKDDPAAREALRAALRLKGDSCLLRHEVAYILGQIGESDSVQDLCSVLEDATDDEIVRHEAAEALGAIGDETARPFLEKFSSDRARVVRETCRLALDLLEWRGANEAVPTNSYRSVDPAPPAESTGDLEDLKRSLLDADRTMWDRYRAMFTLRDLGTRPAVLALAEAVTLSSDRLQSDLLRHEIAFVLGQLADEAAAPALKVVLHDTTMHPMVRHEAAEALGAMSPGASKDVLSDFSSDNNRVVAESCVVALDAMAYYTQEC